MVDRDHQNHSSLDHAYGDIVVTAALIALPFIVGFSGHTTALVFYLIVGASGLGATLATVSAHACLRSAR
jgi:hypothetical protein